MMRHLEQTMTKLPGSFRALLALADHPGLVATEAHRVDSLFGKNQERRLYDCPRRRVAMVMPEIAPARGEPTLLPRSAWQTVSAENPFYQAICP